MKNLKIILTTVAYLIVGLIPVGCSGSDSANPINLVEVKAKDLEEPKYNEENSAAQKVADGANDFAFKLSSALSQKNKNEDFLCSPYSVWLPLAALVNATDSANKEALLNALGSAGISEKDINEASSRMLFNLTGGMGNTRNENNTDIDGHNPLKIVNAIFIDNDMHIKKDFAQKFMDYFRGAVINTDFESDEAVKEINKWASDNTDGLIDEIVQKFDPNTIAAIANAIYFSDRWNWEFAPEDTKEDIFYSPNGESKAFYMLHEGDSQFYYEDDNVQAMPLKFLAGGGMFIILPKDGDAKNLLENMTSEYFNKMNAEATPQTGKLLLPRFSIESGLMDLKDSLTELGVPLFDDKKAPLTGGLIEENLPIWMSKAVQKAVIEVDEKGTTAAAVTVMELVAGAAMPEPTEPFEMICNKPFVFVLYGNTYDGGNQILFTGYVNKP